MGIFDNLNQPANSVPQYPVQGGNRSVNVVFPQLPDTFEQFKALPQAALATPFDKAALPELAFFFCPLDRDTSLAMVDFLKGPQPLSNYDKSFIADRFRGVDYIPRSYFNGATPQNDYRPSQPYTVTVSENPYSYQNQGYAKLFIRSGGADSPREVLLRQAKDGKWYLWEQYLLVGIRTPESSNPWA